MNLDASKAELEKARIKNAHSAMCLSHKGRDTIKRFAGCGPVGETIDGSLAQDGNSDSLSDSLGAKLMNLLDCVPWHAVNVDKGFLMDNTCAVISIGCTRPPKKLRKQVQQLAKDMAQHAQKVGIARIVVEQVLNGGAWMSCMSFNGTIPPASLRIRNSCPCVENAPDRKVFL
jgi:hypothetical protein